MPTHRPQSAKTKVAAIRQQMDHDQLAAAQASARRLLTHSPTSGEALDLLREIAERQGQFEQALYYAQQSSTLEPDDVVRTQRLASVLSLLGRHDEAIVALRTVVARAPDDPDAHRQLCAALLEAKRLIDAEHAARAALQIHPSDHQLAVALASSLLEQGRARAAGEVLSRLLFEHQQDPSTASFLATVVNYEYPVNAPRIFATHQNYGRLLELSTFVQPIKHERPARGAARTGPLRVGFISSDFRSHSVAYFIEPLLRGLDRQRITPLLYYTLARGDATTGRLKALAERLGGALKTVAAYSPPALAGLLHREKLDVLIELNGLTAHHKLEALRYKPAPVQITFCGYPATTGLRTIDYRIVDSTTDPRSADAQLSADRWATERLARLDPCFLCYGPPEDAPAVSEPPYVRNGFVTIGSFNAIHKLSDGCVDAWSAMLRATPTAHLALKAQVFDVDAVRNEVASRFTSRGVDPSRLHMMPPTPGTAAHLAAYSMLDLALDSFPYSGTTTTCEALLMGVPVVTLCPPLSATGGVHAQRVSASLLSAAGLTELVAESESQYVRLVTELCTDPTRLSGYRRTLRDRLFASPLCDAPAYARRFETLITDVWSRWARGDDPLVSPPEGRTAP